jgi:hypothetical protein
VFCFFKLTLFNGAFVASWGQVTDLWVFPTRGALGRRFPHGHVAGRPRNLWTVVFHITAMLSPDWPTCKELQISELSAREGYFALVNSLRQLSRVTSFLPQQL